MVSQSQDGNTLLLLAAGNKDIDLAMFKSLLNVKAAVNAKNNNAASALHMAATAGNMAVAKFILGHEDEFAGGKKPQPLLDIDTENVWSETPLHDAARAGQPEMCRLLLHLGNARSKNVGRSQSCMVSSDCAVVATALRRRSRQ